MTKATPFPSSAFWVDVESSWDTDKKGETSGNSVIWLSVPEDEQLGLCFPDRPCMEGKGPDDPDLGGNTSQRGLEVSWS